MNSENANNFEDLCKLIYIVRGVKVMLDADLASIYGYTTKAFNQQVKNNIEKFDADFRFQLTKNEYEEILRSKILTSKQSATSSLSMDHNPDLNLRSKILTANDGSTPITKLSPKSRTLPYAFTEQGIYMLMTVLKGELATEQSKALIRTFKSVFAKLAASFMTGTSFSTTTPMASESFIAAHHQKMLETK